MKVWRMAALALLGLLLIGSTSCNPFGEEPTEVTQELVEVTRGDLTVTVSGSGSIEIANEIKLAFGVGGRVTKIYIKEGAKVSQGTVLAQLETDALELAIAQAQVAVAQTEVAINQAQFAITQAQLARQTAEYELDKAENVYKWPAIEVAQADVERARLTVKTTQDRLEAAPTEQKAEWTRLLANAQANLILAENKLNAMLAGADTKEVALKKLQVEAARQSLELAQQSLELNQKQRDLAQQSLAQGRKQLDEAIIFAPFDGVVANTYAKEGDLIPSPNIGPKPIIHLVDLSNMRLKVQVDEIDIIKVKAGQKATIEMDALPASRLEGKVHAISLLPTQAGGVIIYDVKIEFPVAENSSLKAGMSATADIIVAERSNTLLVPDRAIKRDSQGNTKVEVMVNGKIEERAVVTGVSDGTRTEILEGLQEGEMVIEKRTKPKTAPTGLF